MPMSGRAPTGPRREPGVDTDRLLLGAAGLCLAAALVAVVLVRGPLLFDGSFFLFQVLQSGAPYIPDNRFLAVPIHVATLGVARLTDDPWTIALAFSAMYLALAAGAYLGAAWWLRRSASHLAAWPILGLLVVSPILLDTTTESLVTGGLAFVMVHLAATAKSPRRLGAAAVVAAVLFISHPIAGLVLLMAAGAAVLHWERAGRRDRVDLVFVAVSVVIGVVRLRLLVPGYESYIATPGTFVTHLVQGIRPAVALVLVSAWVSGTFLLLARRGGGGPGRRALALLPVAGAVPLVIDIAAGHGWPPELDYRLAIVPALLPLLAMLAIDANAGPGRTAATSFATRRVVALAMLAVSAILGVQAWRWNGDVGAMRAYVAAAPSPCMPDLVLPGRATGHWGGRSLALLVEGRNPAVVLGSAAECGQLRERHLYSGSTNFVALYPTRSGWFRLPNP